ncbi:MAG: hypothetical protein K2K60_06410 [Clostridia bacterium]|nr:hypothetical protein [Clostridia bacterium]
MKVYSTLPTRKILDNWGSPDEKLKIIHIAGTNGKGSTAEFFTNILIAAKSKVGTFTSPLVYDYYDQFKIDGKSFSADKFQKYLKAAKEVAPEDASEFEIETAAVIYAFAQEGCEYAVIECGMGGLNDATNAISKKALAVITSISLEHTEYLGDTIEKICAQKAGIIKNCPVVINAHQTAKAARYFENLGYKLCKNYPCGLSVEGSLQPFNASTAIEGAKILGVDEKAIFEGIKNTKPAGRLERLSAGGVNYILDGGHNPAALVPLADTLKNEKDITVIFGCLSDKDIDGNLKTIDGCAERIIAVSCPSPRARSLAETEKACRKYFKDVKSAQSVANALDKAQTQTVVVCGSFTLLKEAKEWIGKRQ